MAKAYIAATTRIIGRFIQNACEKKGIEVHSMQEESQMFNELKIVKPDVIFLQANIIEEIEEDIILKIKADDELGRAFIVVHAARTEGALFSTHHGADAFLPIPFVDAQVLSIFRRVLNQPKHLLIITKNKTCGSPIFLSLIERGYMVHSVNSGARALEFAKTYFPDLILCEIELSDMRGPDFCVQLHQDSNNAQIPIIVLSDSDTPEAIEECIRAGVKHILLEPFDSEQNMKKLQEIVSPPTIGRKLRALVIDDSGTIRNLISRMFQEFGFEVQTAKDGLEGIRMVDTDPPDIITTDFDMPIMNGWQFCTEMKKNPKVADIPVIMITCRDTDVDIKKGHFLGVSAYLPKPFKQEELKATVKEALEIAKKKKQEQILSKYVAMDTIRSVKRVVEDGTEQETEERFITVLFSDICSFSSKCERLSAKKIVTLLNAYFDLMVDQLHDNEAIIDKFIGDAIVARFDDEDHSKAALNAVRAALAMLEALNKFNEESIEEIHVRIGINSGEVIMGNLGSEKYRLEYAMIGDNVNIGQRLESKAPKQGCLISEATYELIKDQVEVGELQELEVKGRKAFVKAYVLKGLK
ncbi:response regulator [Candidatus Margulisiibacteriota bacterium]